MYYSACQRVHSVRIMGGTSLVCRLAACILVSVVAGTLVTSCGSQSAKQEAATETGMQRVLKKGTIRCSYLVYSSYFRKDPNTGTLSGIFHDVVEEIGKRAGLKIDWVEEVGYANIFPGLEANRCDVFCGGLWANASRAKSASFSVPIFYSAITTWCRPSDHRFDKDLSAINTSKVTIATIDGAMEDIIAKTDFPDAKRESLPELSPFVQNFLNIVHNKADVTFAEPMVVNEFLKTNPNALRQVAPDRPVRVFGNSLAVKAGETRLKEFLDVALQELVNDGTVQKVLEKYEPNRNTFYPLAKPYRLPDSP